MLNYLGIQIGSLYFPTSILLITLLLLAGFLFISFLEEEKTDSSHVIIMKSVKPSSTLFIIYGFFCKGDFSMERVNR